MSIVRPGALCVALAAALPVAASAADSAADLKQLRDELRALRETYQHRIDALEKRLADSEARAARAETTATAAARSAEQAEQKAATLPEVAAAVARPPTGEGAFNPAVSLILDSKFTRMQQDPETYRIDGFIPSGGDVGPPRKGFSLGESELAVSANVDHLFRGNARFSLADDGAGGTVEVEEAHIETLALPDGLKLKAGRFLSGVGYLNVQHPHEWDFTDAPLAYKAFLGPRLQNDGVQLRWVAPTDLFVELGSELASGQKYPGAERAANGAGLWTAFAHVGGDLGTSSAWQAGLSHVHANPRARTFEDGGVSNAFSGRSRLWIADFVYKWAPDGNPTVNNLKVQGEFFRRSEDGDLRYDTAGAALTSATSFRQSGGYLQAVYQFMPHWRAGVRGDWLRAGSIDLGSLSTTELPGLAVYNPSRQSAMVDWSPSEFSRLRLQLARDTSRAGETDHQLWLQYIMSLGAHGAHKF